MNLDHGCGIRLATLRGMYDYSIYSTMHLRKIGLYSQISGLGPELNAISNPETFMVCVQPSGFLRNWYQPNKGIRKSTLRQWNGHIIIALNLVLEACLRKRQPKSVVIIRVLMYIKSKKANKRP